MLGGQHHFMPFGYDDQGNPVRTPIQIANTLNAGVAAATEMFPFNSNGQHQSDFFGAYTSAGLNQDAYMGGFNQQVDLGEPQQTYDMEMPAGMVETQVDNNDVETLGSPQKLNDAMRESAENQQSTAQIFASDNKLALLTDDNTEGRLKSQDTKEM